MGQGSSPTPNTGCQHLTLNFSARLLAASSSKEELAVAGPTGSEAVLRVHPPALVLSPSPSPGAGPDRGPCGDSTSVLEGARAQLQPRCSSGPGGSALRKPARWEGHCAPDLGAKLPGLLPNLVSEAHSSLADTSAELFSSYKKGAARPPSQLTEPLAQSGWPVPPKHLWARS